MQQVESVAFIADDGRRFSDSEECRKYEDRCSEFNRVVSEKIGDFSRDDLRLGGNHGEAVVDSLPFTAPWMSAFGACLIKVTDIRRTAGGTIEFQLADERSVPYDGGNVWRPSEAFYSEWPQ